MSKSEQDYAIFHMADIHIGGARFAYQYLERTKTMLGKLLDNVASSTHKNKIVVIAGDLIDRANLTEPERQLAMWFVVELQALGVVTIIVEGNHDHYDESGLSMLHPFVEMQRLAKGLNVVCGEPRCIDVSFGATSKNSKDSKDNKDGISFLCIPCKQKFNTASLTQCIIGLKEKAKYKTCYAVVHEALNGSLSNDFHKLKTSCDVPEVSVNGILLGDIHKCQRLGKGVWYCGSPYQIFFEEDKEKGYLLWTRKPEPEFITLKGVPKLLIVDNKKDVEKYENTKHTVQYKGTEVIVGTTANTIVRPKIDPVSEVVDGKIKQVRNTALHGLETFVRKRLDRRDSKLAIKLAKQELPK